MRASELSKVLENAFVNNETTLVVGPPGIGKSDIIDQAAKAVGFDVMHKHLSLEEPTDTKGALFSYIEDGRRQAEFLPTRDMMRLVTTDKPLVVDLEDIGQANASVQAAAMQLILRREVCGAKISQHVRFTGSTNDAKHMAGVSGLLEPVKSRCTILKLDVNLDDFCFWGIQHGVMPEVIAHVRSAPQELHNFKPTRDITNGPCPRTWASLSRWLSRGIKNKEVFAGCVGESSATLFWIFLDMHMKLPNLDGIISDPDKAEVPTEMGILHAVSIGLARRANRSNLAKIIRYLERLPKEFRVYCLKDAIAFTPDLMKTKEFTSWAVANKEIFTT